MENTNQNQSNKVFTPEKAKAWIITLALGIVVCSGLIIYSLITHNPGISFLDSSLFKPGLTWVGSIAMILFIISYLFFGISTSILNFLPEKTWAKFTTIGGIFFFLVAFFLLFISYNIETEWIRYVCFVCEITGLNMLIFKDIIQQKYYKISKIWNLTAAIALLTGIIFFAFSFDA